MTFKFGQLIYLLRDLTKRCVNFALIIAFELLAFVVICMMVNKYRDNSVETCITLLFEGTIYGEYSIGGVFIVQIFFTVFNLLAVVLLTVYLIKDVK